MEIEETKISMDSLSADVLFSVETGFVFQKLTDSAVSRVIVRSFNVFNYSSGRENLNTTRFLYYNQEFLSNRPSAIQLFRKREVRAMATAPKKTENWEITLRILNNCHQLEESVNKGSLTS